MRNLTLLLSLLTGLSLLGQPASGALVSTARNGMLDAIPVQNGDVISATDAVGASGIWIDEVALFGMGADGLPQYLDIDALALLPDGRVVFSVDEFQVGQIGGLVFNDGDLVAYDPADGSVQLFLAQAAFGEFVDVDAVHVRSDGHVLVSFSRSEVVGGVTVKDGDIYDYDPQTGTGAILISEEQLFLSFPEAPEVDVNGISMVGDMLILTTREAATFVDGLAIEGSDLALYDLATGASSLYLSLGDRLSEMDLGKDLDAVAFIPECQDGIDNDGDGYVDADVDPGCPVGGADIEDPECQDGIDNDGNGFVDYDGGVSVLGEGHPDLTEPDATCLGLAWSQPEGSSGPFCGLGFELVLLLPALAGLRRARASRA